MPKRIPIAFHNGSNYDSHFIINELAVDLKGQITCLGEYTQYGPDNKKCEICGIKYKYFDSLQKYANLKDDLIEYKCLCCKKNYQQKFDEKLKEWFFNTFFLTTTVISSFCCNEKVVILMRTWMIVKDSLKQHYLKKKIIIIT